MNGVIHSKTPKVVPLKFRNVKYFHSTLYNGCNYLSMLESKLNYVSKRGPCKIMIWSNMKTVLLTTPNKHTLCLAILCGGWHSWAWDMPPSGEDYINYAISSGIWYICFICSIWFWHGWEQKAIIIVGENTSEGECYFNFSIRNNLSFFKLYFLSHYQVSLYKVVS